MTREQILAAIRKCACKLKRQPTRAEIRRAGVPLGSVSREFGCFTRALREAGVEPRGSGCLIPTRELLLDWARCARKLGKLPYLKQYTKMGRCSQAPFLRRFGTWRAVPAAFERLAREGHIEDEWRDVLEMVGRRRQAELRRKGVDGYAKQREELHEEPPGSQLALLSDRSGQDVLGGRSGQSESAGESSGNQRPGSRRRLRRERPLAGPPLSLVGLAHEPMNELGVVFFFGMLAERLGFRVLSFHTRFPDCEAMREVRPGQWQRVGIEFEYESRNYRIHGHRRDGCDLIVCWRHNWPGCPRELEVIELSKVSRRI